MSIDQILTNHLRSFQFFGVYETNFYILAFIVLKIFCVEQKPILIKYRCHEHEYLL